MLQPLLKKELRLAAGPIWLTLISSGILLILAWDQSQRLWNPVVTWLGFGAICSYVIASQFGSEISLNCLEWGISQPWSRAQYWKQKIRIALLIYGLVALVWVGIVYWLHRGDISRGTISLEVLALPLIVAVWSCLGPGIYLVLKYRNLVAAMWLTCLLPIGLALLVAYPMQISQMLAKDITLFVTGAEFLYGSLGLWLAWRTFLNWEATGNRTADGMLHKRKVKLRNVRIQTYQYRPFRAAIMREVKLQKTNMLLALACVLCGSVLLVVQKVFSLNAWLGKDLNDVLGVLPSFFAWIVCFIPCAMACVSIAECRRMDVHVCELVSPISRRMQLCIKVLMTLFLGWLCAVVLPFPMMWYDMGSLSKVTSTILFSSIISALGVAVGLYAASMCSGFLKAFSASLIIISVFTGILSLLMKGMAVKGMAVRGGLSLFLPFLIILFFLIRKTHQNFCVLHLPSVLARWNLLQSVVVFAASVFMGWMIEDRFWERWTLAEPAKEESILKLGVHPVMHTSYDGSGAVLSPDGSIWHLGDSALGLVTHVGMEKRQYKRIPVDPPNGYWTQLASSYSHRFAIDSEYRLWYWAISDEWNWFRAQTPFSALVEIGAGREWVKISAGLRGHSRVLAIAKDRTLWAGGVSSRKDPALAELPDLVQVDAVLPRIRLIEGGFRKSDPPIDPSFDWVACLVQGPTNFALNAKGELFAWGKFDAISAWRSRLPMISTDSITQVFPSDLKYVDISGSEDSVILLTKEDATQWIAAKSVGAMEIHWKGTPHTVAPTLYRIDQSQPIRQLTETFYRAPGRRTFLKEEGTLWEVGLAGSSFIPKFTPEHSFEGGTVSLTESQIGRRDDWVYKTQSMGMTADGKIWDWDNSVSNRASKGIFGNMLPPRFRHKVVADLDP